MLRLKMAYANGVRQFQPRAATLGKGVVNEGKNAEGGAEQRLSQYLPFLGLKNRTSALS